MKIVLPIFLACETLDWASSPLCGLLEQRLESLQALSETKSVIVLTDSGHVAEMAKKHGCLVQVNGEATDGTLYERAVLVDRAMISPGDIVLAFDFRAIPATCDDILHALAAYSNNPDCPVISVEKPDDNPVQFYEAYTVAEAGILHLLDPKCSSKQSRLGEGAACVSLPFLPCLRMSNVDLDGVAKGVSDQDGFFRLVWGTGNDLEKNENLAGLTAVPGGLVAFRDPDGEITIKSPSHQSEMVRLVPFSAGGILPGEPIILQLQQGGATLLRPREKGICGYLYTVERHVETGEYAARTLFSFDGLSLNNIRGRQDFPELYRYDDCLCVGTLSQLLDLELLMTCGRTQRIPHAGSPLFKVVSELDVLRLVARRKDDPDAMAGGGTA